MTRATPLPRPTKEDINRMPLFEGLPPSRIHVVKSLTQVEFAIRALTEARFVGFDTETKPTFTKEAVRDGPHVIQFATQKHAFIVQVDLSTPVDFLKSVIESSAIVKVGFGLKSDRGPLRRKLGIRLGEVVDLSHAVRRLGYRQAVGVKVAVAVVLGRRLRQFKSVTTSNWALPKLRPNQLIYAAEDAYAALAVFHAMGMPYTPTAPTAPNPVLQGTRDEAARS
jgi:ribonuclease D